MNLREQMKFTSITCSIAQDKFKYLQSPGDENSERLYIPYISTSFVDLSN